MTLENNFQTAVARVNRMTEKLPDEVLLKLYGCYKVATVGKNNTIQPSILEIKARKNGMLGREWITSLKTKLKLIIYRPS